MNEGVQDKELKALISLLDEPDENIFGQIRSKIFTYGPEAIPSLEYAWENSFNNQMQERILNIIRTIQLDDLYDSLKDWVKKGSRDLLRGFLLASKYQFPDQDEEKITKDVAQIVQNIWLELNNDLTGLEKIKVINHILFDIHKFSANKSNFYAPENFFLKNLTETKKGNPISLGILYITLSQSLRIPVFGVNLPRHFILAYTDIIAEKGHMVFNEQDVLFYINPFNYGAVFTKNEIELYIKQLKMTSRDTFFKPCSNITILKRLFTELAFSYDKSGYADKADDIRKLLSAFK